MTTVSGIKTLELEWVLKGSDPTNSDEFASKFRMVIGTVTWVGIVSDNSTDYSEGLTWDAVEISMNSMRQNL